MSFFGDWSLDDKVSDEEQIEDKASDDAETNEDGEEQSEDEVDEIENYWETDGDGE